MSKIDDPKPTQLSGRSVEVMLIGSLLITGVVWFAALAWGAYEIYEAFL